MANGTDLQEAYKKAILENMQPKNTKEEMWANVIESALPNIGKIVAATTMSGAGAQAFNQATDEGMARSQAQRQAYKLAQEQKQKDFLQILNLKAKFLEYLVHSLRLKCCPVKLKQATTVNPSLFLYLLPLIQT